ncbi:virulence associated lipoprotein (plasmid) [Borrelia hermsii]|uniref:virulence associated lipoprotein n=1 Tax=Borrelia hermsii TaxID=140 RepID=UPI001CF2E811|nr:virulence associated lipoprotein [Borrelia hermsii]UCP01887.1 virulence associated lipoprotein [Borrelia hermsii]
MKYKIFIICILTGLFIPLLALVSCNSEPEKTEIVKLNANTLTPKPGLRKPDPPKPGGGATDPNGGAAAGNSGSGAANQQDEAAKQHIVNHLITLIIPSIKNNISTYNDATWDEVAQKYNIQASNQLFGVIQYTDAKKQPKLYNLQDDKSKTARREMYLGFGYIALDIQAFGALANKMIAAKNAQMKTDLENMVDKIREYGTAYYLTAFNTLIKKQDKLMKLDLSDLQTLKVKFDEVNSTDNKIYSAFANSIEEDYNKNIEIGTAKHTLQDNATAEEIQKYLKDKFTPVKPDFDKIIKEATDVAGILNKIQ